MIVTHALSFALNQLESNPKDVYVFVSTKEMEADYRLEIEQPVNIIVTETYTARDKFNYIHKYFTDGRDVLLIEDDVKGLVTMTDKKPKKIVADGFKIMHERGKKIWGVYPSSNKLFMQMSVLTGFAFIVANIYGYVADGDESVLVENWCKTDYERSILYSLHKGGVVRLNYVAPVTKNYTNKGGMQDLSSRYNLEKTSCEKLIKKYPSLVAYKKGTKSKYPEIKFIKQ
jgi:hypothetical protein